MQIENIVNSGAMIYDIVTRVQDTTKTLFYMRNSSDLRSETNRTERIPSTIILITIGNRNSDV